jgi:hypothetical protein
VQACGGDDAEHGGGAFGVVVATAEQPCLAAGGDRLDGAFGAVVGQDQASIVDEALQSTRWRCVSARWSLNAGLCCSRTQAKKVSPWGRRWAARSCLISDGGFFCHDSSSSKMRPMRAGPSRPTGYLATAASHNDARVKPAGDLATLAAIVLRIEQRVVVYWLFAGAQSGWGLRTCGTPNSIRRVNRELLRRRLARSAAHSHPARLAESVPRASRPRRLSRATRRQKS